MFTANDIPSLVGKTAIVTGATGGLGLETARMLAGAGASVVLAGRSAQKGLAALADIRQQQPDADIAFEPLDLARLASTEAFTDKMSAHHRKLDILVNNAGVMALPERQATADGFEMQFQTNYLSHFALTARLLPLLIAAPAARVVPLGSVAARQGRIDLADLQSERDYKPMVAYSQSKLACILFAFELQRRSDANGWGITSIAAHPGIARTELIWNGMGASSLAGLVRRYVSGLFQSVPKGALPTLLAATGPQAKRGGYYGPRGLLEIRGTPGEASVPRQALDLTMARRLWDVSVQLSGASFPAAMHAV